MMRAISVFVMLATTAVATSVSAQTPPPPPAYAAPVQPIIQPPPPPPPPIQMAPLHIYEQGSKNQFGALVLEWFLPGAGSLYAGNPGGAFKTWGMTIGGAALLLWGIKRSGEPVHQLEAGGYDDVTTGLIVGGAISLLAGRIFGLVDAWTAAGDHNDELRANLGLMSHVSFGITPLRAGDERGWGPTAQFRF